MKKVTEAKISILDTNKTISELNLVEQNKIIGGGSALLPDSRTYIPYPNTNTENNQVIDLPKTPTLFRGHINREFGRFY